MLLLVVWFTLFCSGFIQTTPIVTNENEDIMSSLSRLHNEVDRIRQRLNPMPDLITFASNDIADRLKRYVHTKQTREDDETVYANLKIDPEDEEEEDPNTAYINLYIDTKRDIKVDYTYSDDDSGYLDTKMIYLNINSPPNNQYYSTYQRYRRRRRQTQ